MRHQLLQRTTAAGLLAAALIAPALAQGTYQVPLETRDALESLLPAADLVARARFGDDAPGYFAELGLGNGAKPWTVHGHANWSSNVAVDVRVSYDGFGRAHLVVGGKALIVDTPGAFEALAVSATAKGAGNSAHLTDVTLNGAPLAQGAKATASGSASAFDGTLVQGASLRKGFVLRGKLRFAWTKKPTDPNALVLEVRVGRLAPQMQRVCASTPNSTGLSARLGWSGVTSVSSNGLVLRAEDGPPLAACIFLVGGTQQSLPYGNGTLCVGPPLDRLAAPAFLDAWGQRTQAVDLTKGPLASGALAVQPGDTRVFQVWFRDPAAGADAFDLTDALLATFLP
jgi:hypothetical protein